MRRRACSATRARRATASAVAWPDSSTRVPEVLAPAELESFLDGVMGPELLEPALGAPVGEDVEEAQELAMDPTRGADDARQEGVDQNAAVTDQFVRMTTRFPIPKVRLCAAQCFLAVQCSHDSSLTTPSECQGPRNALVLGGRDPRGALID